MNDDGSWVIPALPSSAAAKSKGFLEKAVKEQLYFHAGLGGSDLLILLLEIVKLIQLCFHLENHVIATKI